MTREKEIEQAADEAYPTWEEYNIGFIEGAKWADKHPKENLVDIDKAMKVICDGCAQKAECEFNNWKTCGTKDELIKAMKGE